MLVLSILIICAAHYFRTLQWELFIETYEKPDRKNLIRALSLGYVVNYLLPFKVGDIIRAYTAGKKIKNGKGFALATVVMDRYLDILVVGVIFGFFLISGAGKTPRALGILNTFRYYVILAVCLLLILILSYIFKNSVKKIIRLVAKIFNPAIEEKILSFSWALIWSFKDIVVKISKTKLLTINMTMWCLYLLSYSCFGAFLSEQGSGSQWSDVFITLFEKNSVTNSGFLIGKNVVWYGIYYIVPPVLLISMSFIASAISKKENSGDKKEYLNLLPHINEEERRNFLELYFSGKKEDYIKSYLKINRNILILRDYSAGSNATTILCTNGEKNFFRKYAFNADADKLYDQIKWIEEHKASIPLPDIIKKSKEDGICYYDMPYNSEASGMFVYLHSHPYESTWNLISKALGCLERKLYTANVRKADEQTIEKYINDKVIKNIQKIEKGKRLKPLMKYDDIIINGISYKNFSYYMKYLNISHLKEIFDEDIYSDIHGDLTIENIICINSHDSYDDFYIIDPNTGNVHDCPNLDYAKLLQSVHGNYEFLMASSSVEVNDNRVDFTFIKSDAYMYLWKKLDSYLRNNFSEKKVKSIYYHEIIHWLRLMPYKIEKIGKRALLFYCGMLIVLNDVIGLFENQNEFYDDAVV